MSEYQLVTGDCRVALAAMAPGSIDAVVTDPPYGTENGNGYGRRQNYGGVLGRTIAGDADLTTLADVLPQIARVLMPDAWIALFCSPKKRRDVDALLDLHRFEDFGEVVWDKLAPGMGRSIRYTHETVIIAQRGEPACAEEPLLSILRGYPPARLLGADGHPHEKPVDVMRSLVQWCCPIDGVVLDPFMGTGATGCAAISEGRRFIGCELNPEYSDIARRRIESVQPSLFSLSATAEE